MKRSRSSVTALPTARFPITPETGEERFLVEWDRASWRGLVRHPGVLPPAPLTHPAGISLHSAGPEAVRQGVGGGDAEGGRGLGRKRRLDAKARQSYDQRWTTNDPKKVAKEMRKLT